MSELPQAFLQLHSMIRNDLKRILTIDRKSPVYAAALLITTASQALSQLEGRHGHAIFTEILAHGYGVPRPVGRTLFDAIRNGLAHVYDTKTVVVGKESVLVVISWEKRRHLSVAVENWLNDGRQLRGVCLNVKTMSSDLDKHFIAFGERLIREPALVRTVNEHAATQRRVEPRGDALHAWHEFLEEKGSNS